MARKPSIRLGGHSAALGIGGGLGEVKRDLKAGARYVVDEVPKGWLANVGTRDTELSPRADEHSVALKRLAKMHKARIVAAEDQGTGRRLFEGYLNKDKKTMESIRRIFGEIGVDGQAMIDYFGVGPTTRDSNMEMAIRNIEMLRALKSHYTKNPGALERTTGVLGSAHAPVMETLHSIGIRAPFVVKQTFGEPRSARYDLETDLHRRVLGCAVGKGKLEAEELENFGIANYILDKGLGSIALRYGLGRRLLDLRPVSSYFQNKLALGGVHSAVKQFADNLAEAAKSNPAIRESRRGMLEAIKSANKAMAKAQQDEDWELGGKIKGARLARPHLLAFKQELRKAVGELNKPRK